MLNRELRLGDTIDDYCVRCRMLTNHTIVAMVAKQVGKVRCETCYFEHEFRNSESNKKKTERSEKRAS